MADPALPDLSTYGLNVTPYEGLQKISTQFGAGAGFGDADYIAARQAGYTDYEIVAFLKANPYLNGKPVADAILAGKQNDIISGGLPNLSKSDPNRAALVNPNATPYTDPYLQMGIPGRGKDPSVQMYNANVDVAGNETFNQLMQASQSGTLIMAENRLIDSTTGNVIANGVSPTQTKGVYQFNFTNPQSEGSITAYISADPTTGAVGAIDPSKQMAYQAGLPGGVLSSFVGPALSIGGFVLGGPIGEGIASALNISSALAELGFSAQMAASLAPQVGAAIFNISSQVAQGQSLETAAQNVALSNLIQYGSNDLAKAINGVVQNGAVSNAIASAASGAAATVARGGNSDQILQNSLLSAGASTAKSLVNAQDASQRTAASADITNPTATVGALAEQTPATGGGLTTEAAAGQGGSSSNQAALQQGLSTELPVTPVLPPVSVTDVSKTPIETTTVTAPTTTPQLEKISVTAPQTKAGDTTTVAVPELEPISVTSTTPKLADISVSATKAGDTEQVVPTTQPTSEQPTKQLPFKPDISTIVLPNKSGTGSPVSTNLAYSSFSPGSQALAQALNVGNLSGPIFDSTGGKKKNVWNQASLRVKDETGN